VEARGRGVPGLLLSQPSNLSAVIGPMQERLSLPFAAAEITRLAMPFDLTDVPADRVPTPDLTPIFVWHPAAHVIAAIPLEPTARVVRVDPSLPAPNRQRLAGIHAEEVERAVSMPYGQLGPGEPAFRKLLARICHVLTAKHAKPKQLPRRQFGSKLRIEIPPNRGAEHVTVVLLHPVVDNDDALNASALARLLSPHLAVPTESAPFIR
jgi:hypothetical protein